MSRVLVIDDDVPTRRMLRQALERAGYEVIEAHEGLEGVRHCQEAHVDVVITDILMPDKEGLETIRELRQNFPALKIIAISGGGHQGTLNFLEVATRFGAQSTLQKPFSLRQILETIQALLAEQAS
jgi:CheY-like chemotaxis protein